MRKIISLFMAAMLMCNVALADCDWQKDVSKIDTAHYSYTAGCHVKVGETVRDLTVSKSVIGEMDKMISLKNEEIDIANKRIKDWQVTSNKLEDRLNSVQKLERGNRWLYLGIGVIVSGIAVLSVNQITRASR